MIGTRVSVEPATRWLIRAVVGIATCAAVVLGLAGTAAAATPAISPHPTSDLGELGNCLTLTWKSTGFLGRNQRVVAENSCYYPVGFVVYNEGPLMSENSGVHFSLPWEDRRVGMDQGAEIRRAELCDPDYS